MATTIGKVEFTVAFDGKKLPADARRIGREAGTAGGNAFNKSFGSAADSLGSELRNSMKRNGELSGYSFTDAMTRIVKRESAGVADTVANIFKDNKGLDGYVKELGGVQLATTDLHGKLRELRDNGNLTDQMFDRMTQTVGRWAVGARKAERASAELTQSENDANKAREESIVSLKQQLLDFQTNSEGQSKAFGDRAKLVQAISEAERARDSQNTALADRDRKTRIAGLKEEVYSFSQGMDRMKASVDSHKESLDSAEPVQNRFQLAMARINDRMRTFTTETDGGTRSLAKFNKEGSNNSLWNELPRGVKRWTLIIAAIAAAASGIAVLGSAAGSGLTVVAGAVLALGIAAPIAIAGFKGINGELSKLPESVRPAAAAWQDLGKVMGKAQDAIQVKVLDGLAEPFKRLGGLVLSLTPAFEVMGTAINTVTKNILAALTSAQGFNIMNALIKGSAPIFVSLGSALSSLTSALGSVFVTALPYVQDFVDGLGTMLDQFNAFTKSVSGQNALVEWFQNGQRVFGALIPLFGATGAMLNALVTPTTIGYFEEFAGILTRFMPLLGEGLLVLANLDLLSIVAQALLSIGQVIEPLLPALNLLAGMIRDVLLGALQAIVPILTPLMAIFNDMAMRILPILQAAFATLGTPIQGLITALGPLVIVLLSLITGIIPPLVEALTPLLYAFINMASIVVGMLAPAIGILVPFVHGLIAALLPVVEVVISVASTLIAILLPAVLSLLPALLGLITAVAPLVVTFIELVGVVVVALVPAIASLAPVLVSALGAVVPLIQGFLEFYITILNSVMPILMTLIPIVMSVIAAIVPLIDMVLPVVTQLFNALVPVIMTVVNAVLELIKPILKLIEPLVKLILAVLPPLMQVIMLIISAALVPLKLAFAFLIPVLVGVVNTVVDFLIPMIDSLTRIFQGLGEFISGVFAGNWSKAWNGVKNTFAGVFDAIVGIAKGSINAVIGIVNSAIAGINGLAGALKGLTGGAINISIPKIPKLASGSIAMSSMLANIGEAGPEAVVPLRRNLAQVDPSVRALSAFAQGLPVPGGEPGASSGRTVTVEAGAITVVTPSTDPRIAANQVMDRLVAMAT